MAKNFDDAFETFEAAKQFGEVSLFTGDTSQIVDLGQALDPSRAALPAPPARLPKPDDPLCPP